MKNEIDNDKQFETHTIAKVTTHDDGWDVGFFGGMLLWVPNNDCTRAPSPNEEMRLYGRGFGYPVRGITIGENVYRYQTEAEADAQRITDAKAAKDARAAEFIAKWDEFFGEVNALPEPLRQRMMRFLSRDREWGAEFGRYELFACKEAAKIVARLRTVEEVKAFHAATGDEQKVLVPELDYDNHSGNTFGAATMIAHVYLADELLVPKAHGALCGLVGCGAYGCYASEPRPSSAA